MKYLVAYLGSLLAGIVYIAGIVIANGFWSTLFALFIPPWGWYLVLEKLMHVWGWI